MFSENLLSHSELCRWKVIKSSPELCVPKDHDDLGIPTRYTYVESNIVNTRDLIEQRGAELELTGRLQPITAEDIKQFGTGPHELLRWIKEDTPLD